MSKINLNTNDLTEGPIIKKLVLYFLPIAAGTIFQQLYNAVDAIVVSRFVGTEALAAVGGSPSTLTQLIIGFFVALSSGAAVVIAQYCGARQQEKITIAVRSSIYLCVVLGAILTIIMYFCASPILTLLKTPDETLAGATTYVQIYFSASIFLLVFNMGSSILRAIGDSTRPFLYLVAGCVTNIVLDLVFVIVFNMGVPGVAWATFIAQAVSCILVVLKLLRTKEYYRLDISSLKVNFTILSKMLGIGVPSGLQSAMYGISNIILQVGVNTLGTVVVASWSMSGKLDGFYWAVSSAFGTSIMNFVAQNYGAGKMDRIRACAKKGFVLFLISTACISLLLLFLARPLLHIFTTDTAVIDTPWTIMTCFVPVYVTWTIIETLSGILRGMGDAIRPTIITAIGVCALRIVWVLTAFHFFHTLICLCLCYPVSWVVTDIALIIYYRKRSKADFKQPAAKINKSLQS